MERVNPGGNLFRRVAGSAVVDGALSRTSGPHLRQTCRLTVSPLQALWMVANEAAMFKLGPSLCFVWTSRLVLSPDCKRAAIQPDA